MVDGLAVLAIAIASLAACKGGGGGFSSSDRDGAASSDARSVGADASLPPVTVMEPKDGEIGSLCARNGDCESAQCLAIGRCTHACASVTECPSSWGCDGVAAAGLLCTCAPSGDAETCNGRDDDCDGFTDESATCGAGLVCIAGSCQCPPERACGASGCTDLASDPANCGACGNDCGAGGTCAGGACVCGAGLMACAGGACADLSSDRRHCGACGHDCGLGAECIGGACHSGPNGPCTSDADCDGGGTCWTEAQGHPGGECSVPCVEGFLDCPGDALCLVALCYARCSTDTDCRYGYACDWLGTCTPDCRMDPNVCDPGEVCTSSGACASSS